VSKELPLRRPPVPNAYWLPGTRILAGEYPGDRDATPARDKLRALLSAGVTCFLDLTEPGESGLQPYEPLLHAEAAALGARAEYRRLPISDVSVPRRPEDMSRILDVIDAAHRAGHTVYVHCWGGVGRTGTVVACHLVRSGLTGREALDRLAALWTSVEKAWRRPESPETEEQRRYVLAWHEGDTAHVTLRSPDASRYAREQVRGALVGLAVGDAVGTTVEFRAPGTFPPVTDMTGGGPFGLRPGEWTDDTAMALCLAESLIECRGLDPRDQMTRYLRWYRDGHLSSTGRCFDIGTTTHASLERFARTGEPVAGATDPHTAGNGSLMRLAPAALYYACDPERAIEACAASSRTTHGARAAVDACRYLGALLVGAVRGATKRELLSPRYTPVPGYWDAHPLCADVAAVADGSFRRKSPPAIRGSGYVVESLEAALWAFASTSSFREGCLAAANLGDDADTTGAVYGQLAGAFYGEEGIPTEWRARLARWTVIDAITEALAEEASARRGQDA
jgi:ADP-ribosyl-[dinitrogen reductase] hydrolase